MNYRADGWSAALAAATPDGIDVAFDGVGGDVSTPLVDRLHDGSRYLPFGAASGQWSPATGAAEAAGTRVIPLSAIASGPGEMFELVEEALRLAAAGRLHPDHRSDVSLGGCERGARGHRSAHDRRQDAARHLNLRRDSAIRRGIDTRSRIFSTMVRADTNESDRIAGDLLRMARKKARLTQAELAERAGVAQSLISAYETGRRQPTVPTLERLLDAAGFQLGVWLKAKR